MPFEGIDWDELVDLVADGAVVPIVGPELLMVAAAGVPGASLEQVIGEQLAKALHIDASADAKVRDVANLYLEKEGYKSRRRLRPALREVLGALRAIPAALRALAAIDGLKLFVNVTADSLLQTALDEERFGGRKESIALVNAPKSRREDLPAELRRLDTTVVFYPFGQAADHEFAITEEDTLEFLFEMLAHSSEMQRLFDALERSHLLFLGCNFPDWLTRFWIRALGGSRIQAPRETLEVIADRYAQQDKNLVMFLKRTEIRLYVDGDANDFVHALHAQWQKRKGTRVERVAERPPQVFVSFSNQDDYQAAETVNARLREQGLVVWFDREASQSGARVTEEFRRNIARCRAFVPIVSRGAAKRAVGYYRDEWLTAIEVARRFSPEQPFIHPVLVDDITPDVPGIPPEFWAVAAERAPGGAVPPAFTDRIKALVRRAQL